ncbi:hypothetical protein [Bradyrhizobium elkanii]|uniref:hypothetical protein n=1 Tax=Bradyrhizobium elkanii TaxID=29448 RepID=UPI000428C309|nr:hypothetical protein [Bradyrhizobium elkanii]
MDCFASLHFAVGRKVVGIDRSYGVVDRAQFATSDDMGVASQFTLDLLRNGSKLLLRSLGHA